jgi:glycosyltransferase involved in cell wall biosynthesis
LRVVVATSTAPFIRGGGSLIVRDLAAALVAHGHEVETVAIPFSSQPETMLDQMLAFRLFDVSRAGDLLIAVRTPAQLLEHPNKVLWFIHHERTVYDLWGTKYHGFPATRDASRIRDAIIAADNRALRSARKIFTNSRVVGQRLREYNGIESRVLYPPLGDPRGFHCETYGDFVFYPSRLAPIKRQDLLIEAMRFVETDVRLVLAGQADHDSGEGKRLRDLIARHRLGKRVDLRNGWMAEEEKRTLFSQALVGAYPAFDEDSYGYTSLESCLSQKAVVTCRDSGGTLELIEDGVSGIVVEPDPHELARAFDDLYRDRARARRLGEAAAGRLAELEISWDTVVRELTA